MDLHRQFALVVSLAALATCADPEPRAASTSSDVIVDATGKQLYIVELDPAAIGDAPAKALDDPRFEGHDAATASLISAVENDAGTKGECVTSFLAPGFSAFLTEKQVEALSQDPRVRAMHADQPVALSAGPVWTPLIQGEQETSWGTRAVNANGGGPANGGHARIYLIDTGVEQHPDLNVVQRVNALKPDNAGAGAIPSCYPHATHVAGIVGAYDNIIGSRGVAPGAPMVSVSLMDTRFLQNGCARDPCPPPAPGAPPPPGCATNVGNLARSQTAWRCALDWVGRDITARNEVGVINASSNSQIFAAGQTLAPDVTKVATPNGSYKGALFVQSAGNGFTDACTVSYSGTGPSLVVGAIDDHGQSVRPLNQVKGFRNYGLAGSEEGSNHGACVDLWAPGDGVFSTWTGNGYAYLSGTSMAAPHVTALAYLAATAGIDANTLGGLVTSRALGSTDTTGRPINLATRNSVPANPLASLRGELRLGAVGSSGFPAAELPSFSYASYGETFADVTSSYSAIIGLQTAGTGTCAVLRQRGTETPLSVMTSAGAQVSASAWTAGVWRLSSADCPAAYGTMTLYPEPRLRWLLDDVELPADTQPRQVLPGSRVGYRAQNVSANRCSVFLDRSDGGDVPVYSLTNQPATNLSVPLPTQQGFVYRYTLRCEGPAPGLGIPDRQTYVMLASPPPIDAGVPIDAAVPIDASVPIDAAVPIDASVPIDAPQSCGVCTPGDSQLCHGCTGQPVSCMGERFCTAGCAWGPCVGYTCGPQQCE